MFTTRGPLGCLVIILIFFPILTPRDLIFCLNPIPPSIEVIFAFSPGLSSVSFFLMVSLIWCVSIKIFR